MQRTRARVRAHAPLRVLIACEESQAECTAFRHLGHMAFSCDVQACRPHGNPDWHIRADVTPLLKGGVQFTTQSGHDYDVGQWDLIIAHPPCTYLTKVGAVHLVRKTPSGDIVDVDRLAKMYDAVDFFHVCLQAKAPYVAVENPIPMARAGLPKPSCYIHPSWFGVKYTKKTLFWLKNLPPIMAILEYPNPRSYVNCSRGKYRSRTFPQVAEALAAQWSDYILKDLL